MDSPKDIAGTALKGLKSFGGPRVLLRELRQTMAEPLGGQERLDKIVDLIAQNMGAEVCSFYVLRDDAALELFATHGLN
ncbi:MAG TPA: hypothetical protein ENK61_01855, partial [Devosia sp.]|nr:hypothetical protein [Devosia sp.]